MANLPKILLVLFEGLPGTVIESQVLLHARDMARLNIATFEIWAFACSEKLYVSSLAMQKQAEAQAGCRVRILRGVRPAAPFSVRRNAWRLDRAIKSYGPDFDVIHARTDYTAHVCSLLTPRQKFTLIWDCRGDAMAELLDRVENLGLLSRVAYFLRALLLRRDRKMAAIGCDSAIFVTEVLRKLADPDFRDKPSWIIPGTAPPDLFFFDTSLRERFRRDLGLHSEELVYIFSGSLAPYQGFDEMLKMFTAVAQENRAARLLLVTPAVEEAKRRLASYPIDAMVMRAGITEVNGYLNAADVAFMLRSHTATNKAAFPTKFSEYCLAGLPVIMTDAVPDAYRVAERLGNRVAPPKPGVSAISLPTGYDRPRVAARARQTLTRESAAPLYAEAYSFRPRTGPPAA